jgi:prevent-host-death family protein
VTTVHTVTVAEASRRFFDLLEAIERGESVTITRDDRPVAEIRPARRRTGKDPRTALAEIPPFDEQFETDIAEAMALFTT